jgi:ubiquinone/menaquinone biosynthesis C-methylase UbiE
MLTETFANRTQIEAQPSRTIPDYLQDHYWWAYIHPRAVRFFERQWLVNAILCGNFARLRDAVLDELGAPITGRTLQVACVYGDFSVRLADRIAPGGSLDVVDVLPIQLQNLRRKLTAFAPVTLHHRDSTALGFADASCDQAIIFFLLHEQPALVRKQTIAEALRVVKPGGKLVIVDYHRPARFHPLRYLLRPLLRALEPYALDLWDHDIADWLPTSARWRHIEKQTFYGGLYQKLLIAV